MSQLHLGLISHVLQDLSRKAFPIASLTQHSFPLQGTEVTGVTEHLYNINNNFYNNAYTRTDPVIFVFIIIIIIIITFLY